LADVRADEVIWLAGSTFPPEEELLIEVFQRLTGDYPQLRLLLVPRHPERFAEVAGLLARADVAFVRRSALAVGRGCRERVLLVDSMGELSAWWGLAQIGFVGGSLGKRGGQNMIEPAGCGVAVCFGPRTENFRDIVQLLLEADAARVVHDATELEGFVRHCLDDPLAAARLGQRARSLVGQNLGAAARTVDRLLPLLPARAEPARRRMSG
jgi:3-deoxy-D-manno-octulosonic-acid transferase